MKNTRMMIVTATLAVFLLNPQMPAAGLVNYVRPVLATAESTEDGIDSGSGGFIQVGGGDETYDLSVEAGYLQFDQTVRVDETYSGEGDVETVPLLATVKWRGNLDREGKFALLIGPSLGVTYVDAAVEVFENDARLVRLRETAWSFTYGIDAQVRLSPTPRFDVTLGYKYLIADGITFGDELIRVETPDLKAHVFYAGIGFVF